DHQPPAQFDQMIHQRRARRLDLVFVPVEAGHRSIFLARTARDLPAAVLPDAADALALVLFPALAAVLAREGVFRFGAGSGGGWGAASTGGSGSASGGLSGHSSGLVRAGAVAGASSGRFRSSRMSRKAASASAPSGTIWPVRSASTSLRSSSSSD